VTLQASAALAPEVATPASATAKQDDAGPIPGLVWAFRFHADGAAEALDVAQPIERGHDGWLWLHFNLADGRACRWLAAAPDLPDAARAVLLCPDHHQQLHATDTCVYGVFADLVRHLDRPSEETGHLSFVMTERQLISGRHHALHAVEAARQALQTGRKLPNVASLLELIVENAADAYDQIADEFAVELDGIEERILVSATRNDRQTLGRLRRITVRLHRQLAGLRTLFHRLERNDFAGCSPALRLATGKLAQRLDGLDHEIVAMRERTRLLQEEIGARLSEETNRHLNVLSILTTLFLPATLVTGVFGMNTKGLPFTENEAAFLWAMAFAVGSSVLAYWVMRRLGIFD
jgi:zinc transporter